MKKIRFIIKKVKNICIIAKKLSRNKLEFFTILCDLIYCRVRFHVTGDEYLKYNFHNFKNRYRKNFLLMYHKGQFCNITKRYFGCSKYLLYKRIPNMFSRGITLLPYCGEDGFLRFMKKYKKIIIKPDTGSFGRDIEVFKYTNDDAAHNVFRRFSGDRAMICEEFLQQHHLMAELNPSSVNTLRVVTILYEGKVEIVSAALKTGGSADAFIDNMHGGGIGAQIDIESGIVTTFGTDYNFNTYIYHPVTGKQFIGFNIPHWDKVREFVIKGHLQIPQCLIYGWDIAITEEGPELIEVNNSPGPMLMQTMDQIPKGEKIIKMLKTIKIKQEYAKNSGFTPDYEKVFEQDL